MISFQELFTGEASAEKYITLLTESLPVNMLVPQPAFLFKEWQLSQIFLEAVVWKRSLKVH